MAYLTFPYTDEPTRTHYEAMAAHIEGAHVDYERSTADIYVVGYSDHLAMVGVPADPGDPNAVPPIPATDAVPPAAAVVSWRLDLTPDEIASMREGFAALLYQILLARPQFASATLVNAV